VEWRIFSWQILNGIIVCKKGNHRVVSMPALVMDSDCVQKVVDAEETTRLLPNAMITSPYNINFEGADYGEDKREPLKKLLKN